MVAAEFSPRHRITHIAIIFLPGMCDLSFNSSCSFAESLYRQLVRVHSWFRFQIWDYESTLVAVLLVSIINDDFLILLQQNWPLIQTYCHNCAVVKG